MERGSRHGGVFVCIARRYERLLVWEMGVGMHLTDAAQLDRRRDACTCMLSDEGLGVGPLVQHLDV
jgi:hypothetical protein